MRWIVATLFVVLSMACVAIGAEEVRLASIVEMTKFLDKAGGLTPEAPPAEAPVQEAAPVETAAPEVAAEPEPGADLPQFQFEDKRIDQRLTKRLEDVYSSVNQLVQARIKNNLENLLSRNEDLAGARILSRYGDFLRSYNAYLTILQQGGTTRKEREAVSAGIVGVEALRALISAGLLERAKETMPEALGKARNSTNAGIIALCDDTMTMEQAGREIFPVLAALDKAAVRTPADERAKRKEAARLIARALLCSGIDHWRYFLAGNPALSGYPTSAGSLPKHSKTLVDWPSVYTDLTVLSDRKVFLGYRDAVPFTQDLTSAPTSLDLPVHYEDALFSLIMRFPGHQVVQSGEAFLRLADSLAELEAYGAAYDVCQLMHNIAPECAPAKEGEALYMMGEAAFKDRKYTAAMKCYQSLLATNKDHRAVRGGNIHGRIAECNRLKDVVQ